MNDIKKTENYLKNININLNPQQDQHIHENLQEILKQSKNQPSAKTQPNIWRIIMKSKITKYATAAVLVAAALLSMTFLDKSVTPAYAIEQTLAAMQKLRTVHMHYRDWHNDEHEMWIQLDPKTGIPEYYRAYSPKLKTLEISTPKTSYQYNERGNVVQINSGKLRNIDIVPDKMFEQLLQASKTDDPNIKVQIHNEYDSKIGKNLIVAIYETPNVDWKIFIDPETKLPVRMHCLKLVNKMGSTFKDIDQIEFNIDLPEDIFKFEIPEGAKIIDHDKGQKILNDPQYGISTESLTEQQAAEQIVTEYWNSLIARDITAARKVSPVGAQMVDGSLLVELVEVGKLYVEPGCGMGKLIPCTLRYKDNNLKIWKLIIKSRNINGNPSCVIAGYFNSPKEIK